MPGRLTPPMPERLSPQWAISALTSVPAVVAGGRMHDEPGRLVDDDEVVVLVDDGERDRLAPRLGRRRRRARSSTISAPGCTFGRDRGPPRPSTLTRPSRISACRRLRDRSPNAAPAPGRAARRRPWLAT